MDLKHLAWPFFESRHRDLAEKFRQWASEHLTAFESDEGGDGKAARKIFQLLGEGGHARAQRRYGGQDCVERFPLKFRHGAILVKVATELSSWPHLQPFSQATKIAVVLSNPTKSGGLPCFVYF